MLNLHNFHKSYSTGFSISVDHLALDSGIHLIKGANGSGKSTLLKAIAGIHDFKGEINLLGVSIKKDPVSYRKMVNFSEAEPVFPEFLSLDELINFTTSIIHEDKNQILELKEKLDIRDYSENPISSYSSGMLKKSALLLAFLGEPKLIILDEPFTTIDLATQDHLKELILKKQEEGVSFILTSHMADFEDFFAYHSVHEIKDGSII
ncbi:ABC transporter ATP-binding protein [Algoriphagus machipongonensis]|uniref:ABC-type multidrug transport system, ATPase component n=1 Tax=Algoriphagus machipongonensis TaxID=388413 RepID=A3HWG4_9BACT|nr:ATP-binding cassette domain-containing protein [Algoriphagus machipongonensis]EAZ80937.1 ABC-type multidrug transport system, ATPase component [Algoriphagus machipongonensis]